MNQFTMQLECGSNVVVAAGLLIQNCDHAARKSTGLEWTSTHTGRRFRRRKQLDGPVAVIDQITNDAGRCDDRAHAQNPK